MERTIDVSTKLSTQVPPDTINVDITIRGTSKIREDCTAKYNVLLQTVKDALEKNGLPASILKTTIIQYLVTRKTDTKKMMRVTIMSPRKNFWDMISTLNYPSNSTLKKILSRKSGKHSVHVVMK